MFKKIGFIFIILSVGIFSAEAQAFRLGKVAVNAGGTVLVIGDVTPGVHLSVDVPVIKLHPMLILLIPILSVIMPG